MEAGLEKPRHGIWETPGALQPLGTVSCVGSRHHTFPAGNPTVACPVRYCWENPPCQAAVGVYVGISPGIAQKLCFPGGLAARLGWGGLAPLGDSGEVMVRPFSYPLKELLVPANEKTPSGRF